MTKYDFFDKTELDDWSWTSSVDHLPCFIHRYTVTNKVRTDALIKEYIKHASEDSDNDVLLFSVTERDTCWKAWAAFAKAHPRTFKVVEGGSIHGKYSCRVYIYTKPPAKRKFHADNIKNFRPR